MRQPHSIAIALLAALMLGGCASLNTLSSDVSTFGEWPAGRTPGTYAFERLPSQQAQPDKQQRLEDAARAALESIGFTPADDTKTAGVTVQLGAKVEPTDRSPFDDPFWWHGGLYRWRLSYPGWSGLGGWGGSTTYGGGFGGGLGYGNGFDTRRYEREVLVLIRDRASGTPVFEARASNNGISSAIEPLLGAMFTAALKDFPASDAKPRQVDTKLTP